MQEHSLVVGDPFLVDMSAHQLSARRRAPVARLLEGARGLTATAARCHRCTEDGLAVDMRPSQDSTFILLTTDV